MLEKLITFQLAIVRWRLVPRSFYFRIIVTQKFLCAIFCAPPKDVLCVYGAGPNFFSLGSFTFFFML